MAKRSKSKRDHKPAQRDLSRIAKPRLLSRQPSPNPVSSGPSLSRPSAAAPLRQVEDRRSFHPEAANRPALSLAGTPAVITVKSRPRPKPATRSARAQVNRFGSVQPSQTKAALTFAAPAATVVCIRRQRRKEVLFAKGKTSSRSHRRRSWLSKISCRSHG